MPEALKKFLEGLDDKSADEIWLWLDSEPLALDEMIETIAISHKELGERIENNLKDEIG